MTENKCQFIPLQDNGLSQKQCDFLLKNWSLAQELIGRPQDSENLLNFRTYIFIERLIRTGKDHLRKGFYDTEADRFLTTIQTKLGLQDLNRPVFLDELSYAINSVDLDELLVGIPQDTIYLVRDEIAALLPNPKPLTPNYSSFSTQLK